MVDVLTPEQRSRCMSRIKGKNTKPEMVVRRLVHGMGYRYRLHDKRLPGRPDIVLVRHRKVIFVNGCFWHMHRCRFGTITPETNAGFWREKREASKVRDRKNLRTLRRLGWRVLVVWECWTKDDLSLHKLLETFLKE